MKRNNLIITVALALATGVFQLSAADPAPAAKPYPLDKCIVSGEALGTMGKPVVFVQDGQEIKLCCKSCKPKFDKEPAKYLKTLPVK